MAATIIGTVGKHGVLGEVPNLIVTSYSVKRSFELKNPQKDQNGITVGVRYDGPSSTADIEGTVLDVDMPGIGEAISFDLQTDVGAEESITGIVEEVTESGRNGDYVTFKATVAQWDSIAEYEDPPEAP